MKLQYFPDTDTLYIDLSDTKVENTDMINHNLIVDFDAEERVVGITIEEASRTTDLTVFETVNMGVTAVPQV